MKKQNNSDENKIRQLLEITENLNHIKDIDSLLDKILLEARRFTNADAGSIYLNENNMLTFSYTQNDTIANRKGANNRFLYSTFQNPIDDKSISGYVALSGKPLRINNVYELENGVPYSFNSDFDTISQYKTVSMLTVPLVTSRQHIVGVMQIINARKSDGSFGPFTEEDMMYVSFFANNASVAIERAKMTREIVLRMIKMAELRDPKETGSHVNRVASYSIEIYEHWAKMKGIPMEQIKKIKDVFRISAMLHDVGKVAISDTILKKPAKLTEEEFEIMKKHTIYGAELFQDPVSDWDSLSAEIALNHHEKWDGTGYMGHVPDFESDGKREMRAKKGEEIPILARIVALSDVYDALISRRTYKEAWKEEEVLVYIRKNSGTQFDPEVVNSFFEIYDTIKAIREKYSEQHEKVKDA